MQASSQAPAHPHARESAAAPLRTLTLTASDVARHLMPYTRLMDALRDVALRGERVHTPLRHHHALPDAATLLLMPSWLENEYVLVKVATVFPGNARRTPALPAVHASVLLHCARTGRLLALMDGSALTMRRTAAVSALAGRYLVPRGRATLTMVVLGAGAVAEQLVHAHRAAQGEALRCVHVWNHRAERADELAARLREHIDEVHVCADEDALRAAVQRADIVSTATLSDEPVLRGAWLRPGTHVDLVGSYKPTMREADDDVVRRACIFVDTLPGAAVESGDLAVPLRAGVLRESDVLGTLADLATGRHGGRDALPADAITVFKSVGTAASDLAAAMLAYECAARDA